MSDEKRCPRCWANATWFPCPNPNCTSDALCIYCDGDSGFYACLACELIDYGDDVQCSRCFYWRRHTEDACPNCATLDRLLAIIDKIDDVPTRLTP